VIATEWMEFRSPDFDRIRAALKQPLIFDGRNLYDRAALARLQFRVLQRRPAAGPKEVIR